MARRKKKDNAGVYRICNKISGKEYVGSSSNLGMRRNYHMHQLKHLFHDNRNLDADVKLHGAGCFEFEILEVISDVSKLTEREQHYIDLRHPAYNICQIAGSSKGQRYFKGKKHKISSILLQAGEKGPNAALTQREVEEIRSKYVPRVYSSYRLANEYGVSRQQINKIINKENWKYGEVG